MEIALLHLLLLLSISLLLHPKPATPLSPPSPYLSPSIFYPNYQKMLQNFKIFTYSSPQTLIFNTQIESLFHTSLLKSHFTTPNPNQAHLFFFYLPPNSTHRSISRNIKDLVTEFPFWNRTLGADHFYISCDGIGYESDRNLVELKKNSIQISCFPSIENPASKFRFIPHKDVTLPPLFNSTTTHMRYLDHHISVFSSHLIEELTHDPDFVTESSEMVFSSKFCLFSYGDISVSGIGEALRYGCVPVVITDRPIVELPFIDVLRWTEIAVFVERGGGVKEVKDVLSRTCGEKYEKMRESGRTASKHFVWNSDPQPYDAFHMVLYQLWIRRHTIRYARWDVI